MSPVNTFMVGTASIFLLAAPRLSATEPGETADVSAAERSRNPVARPARIAPPDVLRGDRVSVVVVSGPVQLKFDAETESAGHIGENVIVKNPENGRRFVARIEDKGKVVVKK